MMLPLAAGVPKRYAATVGRIVISWALVEYRLRLVAKRLLGIGQKQARVALAQFRAVEFLTRIEELATLRHFTFKANIRAMKPRFSRCETLRDLIAHSAWLRDGKAFRIQYTKGRVPGTGRNRRLYPEGIPVTREYLSGVLRDIKACIRDTKLLVRETDKLIESRHG
jgi:hypothetical protein